MYKYYSLERPVSLGTYPRNRDNPMIAFENFSRNSECVKETVRDNDKTFNAWGYLIFRNPLTAKDISDYELGDAGAMPRNTKIKELPDNLTAEIMNDINAFYKKAGSNFRMTEEGFLDMYGTFSLDDFNKMMTEIASKYHFINAKDKSPLEKLMEGNFKYESILDTMESKEDAENEEEYER